MNRTQTIKLIANLIKVEACAWTWDNEGYCNEVKVSSKLSEIIAQHLYNKGLRFDEEGQTDEKKETA